MHLVKSKSSAYISLVCFSILSIVIWRTEVEFHGWKGLIWLSYFKMSIPICLSLFVIWINVFFTFGSIAERGKINVVLVIWVLIGTIAAIATLELTFITGPSAMFLFVSDYDIILLRAMQLCVLLLPLIALFSLRLLRIRIPVIYISISYFLFLAAFPISTFLLDVLNHKGSPDFIHAVKSGFVFPILFFSLGLPLIYSFKHERN